MRLVLSLKKIMEYFSRQEDGDKDRFTCSNALGDSTVEVYKDEALASILSIELV